MKKRNYTPDGKKAFLLFDNSVLLPIGEENDVENQNSFSTLKTERRKPKNMLVFGFRRLLFDVEKGACFSVFDAPFSMSKTSFGFRNHFLHRLVGERYVEKQKRFLVFGFRRPDWTDLS